MKVKLATILALVFALCANASFAQDSAQPELKKSKKKKEKTIKEQPKAEKEIKEPNPDKGYRHYGIKIGGGMSNVWGSLQYNPAWQEKFRGTEKITYKPAATIGGFINYNFDKRFAFQGELLFHMKGAEYEVNFHNAIVPTETGGVQDVPPLFGYKKHWDFTFAQVQIPLMAKISLTEEGVQPYIMFGATVGILALKNIESTVTLDSGSVVHPYVDSIEKVKTELKYNPFEVGLVAGCGLAIPIKNRAILIETRYDLGLLKMAALLRNQMFSLQLGFQF